MFVCVCVFLSDSYLAVQAPVIALKQIYKKRALALASTACGKDLHSFSINNERQPEEVSETFPEEPSCRVFTNTVKA